MSRQTTDQLYIELDYYYPEEYYTYQAEAVSAHSAESSVDVTVGKVYDFTVTCDALFTPSLDVSAVKNTFAVLDATTSLTAQGYNTTQRTVTLSANISQTTANSRIRYDSALLEVIAECEGFATIIDGGVTHEAHAHLQSEFTRTFTVNAVRHTELDFYVTVYMTPDGVERVRDESALLETAVTLSVEATRTRNESAQMSADFAQSSSAGRIQQANITCDALFSPSMTVEAVRNAFAVLDSTSALAVVAIANRSADIALASIINLSSQGDKFVGYAVNASAEFAQTTNNERTRNESASITADFATSADNARTRDESASISAEFAQTTDNTRTRSTASSLSSNFTGNITVNEIVQLASYLDTPVTLTAQAGTTKPAQITCEALFAPNFEVNARTNTFAVLDATATMAVTAVKTPANTVNITATTTASATALRIKQLDPYNGYYVDGIQFTPANINQATVGDPWINITGSNVLQTGKYAIAFWANNPNQYFLTTFTGQDYNSPTETLPGIKFNNGSLRLIGRGLNIYQVPSQGVITWNVNNYTDKWSHYLIYFDVNTMTYPKLYVNGNEISYETLNPAVDVVNPFDASREDLLGFYLPLNMGYSGSNPTMKWQLGYKADYYNNPNQMSIMSYGSKPFSGSVGQFVTWFDSTVVTAWPAYLPYAETNQVPNMTVSNNRYSIFNEGYVDIGSLGTDTFLPKPKIYLGLTTFNDVNNKSNPNNVTVQTVSNWSSVGTGTGPIPEYNNNTYLTVSGYQATSQDQATTPRPFTAVASMLIASRASNSGFVDLAPTFTLDVEALKLHPGEIALVADTQATINNNKITGYSISTTVDSTVNLQGSAVRNGVASVDFAASLVSDIQKFQDFAVFMQTNSQLVNDTVNNRIRNNTVAAVAQAQVQAEPLKIKQLAASLQVEGFVQQVTSKIGSLLVTVDVNSTLIADVTSGVNVQAQLYTQTVQTTEPVKTARTQLGIEARATTQITAKRFRNNLEEFDAVFTQTTATNNSKIVGFSASLNSNFAQTANNGRIRNPGSKTLQATVTQTLTPDNFKGFSVTTTATSQQLTTAVKTVRPQTQFNSIAIELVSGRAISYDRNLTIYIKREYRTIQILEENTNLVVSQETRVNMVRT